MSKFLDTGFLFDDSNGDWSQKDCRCERHIKYMIHDYPIPSRDAVQYHDYHSGYTDCAFIY